MRSILVFLIASFLGSFIYLGIGWVVFDLLLGDFTEQHTTQIVGFKKTNDFSIIFLYLSCLAYASLITYISSLIINTKTVFQAFMQFASIGVLIAFMTNFYWYASSYFYSDLIAVIVDCIGAAFTVGLLGVFNHIFIKNMIK